MIQKEREIPRKIEQLQALLRRLPEAHPKKPQIQEELAKRMAGFRGEQALDYYLLFLDKTKYMIYNDLRLTDETSFFQMDTLVVSSSFLLLVEIKNISGTIHFDGTFSQLVRTKDGRETGFPNPLLQVKRHELQFGNWLELNKFPPIPLESVVVISNPSTIIKSSNQPQHSIQRIIHSANFLTKMEQVQNKYANNRFSPKDLRKLNTTLLKKHTPKHVDILQEFHIRESELVKGVSCPQCTAIPMTRKSGKWICPTCLFTSQNAHLSSLQDYTLLLRSSITNHQLRTFLHITSRNIASDLLKSLNITSTGTKKGTIYHLSNKNLPNNL
ncbi:NERD domain-containing protein [Alkalihalobacillus sp. MEB130]|uniref:nuclease-related domain-containing protein n=1 Tax=Alkalihalobacillus sp. MEB130 TaxID=2976704 RepID=UPI0028DE9207|nr:nuclease-related domain-containing protein [Alkalihalobacillus sp. MEB130]MDT8858702.1 NERD domain-containing protein [Alkalihalobacillus sp. MEB130]